MGEKTREALKLQFDKRLVFQLAEVAVPRELFAAMLGRIVRLCPAPG